MSLNNVYEINILKSHFGLIELMIVDCGWGGVAVLCSSWDNPTQSWDTSAEAEDPAEEAGRKEEVGDYGSMKESKKERK